MNSQKIQGPGTAEVWGVVQMANTCSVLESGIEKMQFYSALTNVKEIQDFVMILEVLKDLYFPLGIPYTTW